MNDPEPIERHIQNRVAARNFYQCAQYGFNANIVWQDHRAGSIVYLCEQRLLPLAKQGLMSTGYEQADADRFIQQRAHTRRNGAWWQRKWVARNGRDLNALVLAYRELQAQNIPVHTWPV